VPEPASAPVQNPGSFLPDRYDLVILGGGLAGQTLARQLTRTGAGLRILVLEKRPSPAPEAAFKVGESSVELSARYFRDVLGLRDHLERAQLPKLGLRYFFPAGDNRDITRRVEVGGTQFPPIGAYQLDRGRLENYLADENRAAGVEVLDSCKVRGVGLAERSDPAHDVMFQRQGAEVRVRARWVVDASGRAGILRRQLGLGRAVVHDINASWFRVSERVAVDDWSNHPEWCERLPEKQRWYSTNHLMGRGYWFWLIPLASGSTSLGLVADARLHPFSRLSRFDALRAWLREYEPQCADVVDARRDRLQDFLALRHYSFGCERVISADRWALIGEAGLFTDPFYSPGSDFIALGNTFVTDLVLRDAAGEDVSTRADRFNDDYLTLFDAFLRLFEGQYPLMGNAQVMSAKVVWDNASYWGFIALLFFHDKYTDLAFMDAIAPLFRRYILLHRRMQAFLRRWDEVDRREWSDAHVNLLGIPFMYALQSGLGIRHDDTTLRTILRTNMDLLEALAAAIEALAPSGGTPGRHRTFERAATPLGQRITAEIEAINLEHLSAAAAR
jgi:flavin-dependent dehydrogenase